MRKHTMLARSGLSLLVFVLLVPQSFAQSGIITTVVGTTPGYGGDGGLATASNLDEPSGIVVDPSGNLYIADFRNNRIRKVTPAGIITTVAGTGSGGLFGDGGPATAA